MNRSELERRLKTEAEAVDLRCPDGVRQRVLRKLRASDVPRPASRWRVPLAAAAVVSLAAVGLWLMPQASDRQPGFDASAIRTPTVSGADLDRAVAGRELDLVVELEKVESDLKRIRRLITNA